ncbi:hypothetical protein ACWGTO_25030 [Mesorhizobium sp. PL10]
MGDLEASFGDQICAESRNNTNLVGLRSTTEDLSYLPLVPNTPITFSNAKKMFWQPAQPK